MKRKDKDSFEISDRIIYRLLYPDKKLNNENNVEIELFETISRENEKLLEQLLKDETSGVKKAYQRFLKERNNKNKNQKKLKLYFYLTSSVAAAIVILFFLFKGAESDYTNTIPLIEPKNSVAILTTFSGETVKLDSEKKVTTKSGIVITNDSLKKLSIEGINESDYNKLNVLQVPKGALHEIILSDGTLVKLNSDSRLTFPLQFYSGTREVLLEGEAFFDVAKSTEPFIVKLSDSVRISVLGTSFNINSFPENNRITATLISGSVKMNVEGQEKSIIITPYNQAIYNKNDKSLTSKPADVDAVISWTEGVFLFHGEFLWEIVLKLEKWYAIDIEFENDSLGNLRFWGGADRNRPANELFKIMEKLSGLNFYALDNKIIIRKNLKSSND
jgi:transmembrane sensor